MDKNQLPPLVGQIGIWQELVSDKGGQSEPSTVTGRLRVVVPWVPQVPVQNDQLFHSPTSHGVGAAGMHWPSERGKVAEIGAVHVGGAGTAPALTGGRARESTFPVFLGTHQFPGPEPPLKLISRGNQLLREKARQYTKPSAALYQ